MIFRPKHFTLQELICPHIFNQYGEMGWQFFDERLMMVLDFLRDQFGPIFINNWDLDDDIRRKAGLKLFDERGLRCTECSEVQTRIKNHIPYCSAHLRGQAVDFNVAGMASDQVTLWLISNPVYLPFPIRLEKKTIGWTHLDVCNSGKSIYKVELFNP